MLTGRPESDIVYVHELLGQRLEVQFSSRREKEAAQSLRAYMEAHDGKFPTPGELDAWRNEPDAPEWRRKLRSQRHVRLVFGSWKAAREAFGVGADVDFLSRRQEVFLSLGSTSNGAPDFRGRATAAGSAA